MQGAVNSMVCHVRGQRTFMLRYAALCAEPQPIKLSCSYPGNMSNKGMLGTTKWFCVSLFSVML